MARSNKVEILINSKADNKGAKEAEKGIKNLGDAFDALMKSAPLAGAAAAAGALTATYEMAKLGASINTVEDRFTALAGSEAEADKFMRQIRQSTNGTIDSMTAMQAVSKFLSMGLADNADQAAKLTSMAVALGDQTMSAGDRIADFSALLANQSIPRLDNFGISSAQVRARIEELQAAMPGLSRELAFNQAVLEIGAQSMDRLGNSVDSQQASIDRLTAIVTNAKNSFASWVADGIVPVLDSASKLFTFLGDVDDALAEHKEAALDTGMSWEDYASKQFDAMSKTDMSGSRLAALSDKLREQGVLGQDTLFMWENWDRTTQAAIESGTGFLNVMDKQTYEILQAARAGEYASESYNDVGASMKSAAQDTEEMTQAVMATQASLGAYQAALQGELGSAISNFGQIQSEANARVRKLSADITELESKRYLTADQKEQLEEMRNQLGEAKRAVDENARAHEEATRRIVLSFLEQRLAMDGLTEAELLALNQIANQWGLLDDATLRMIEGVNQIAGQFESGAISADEFAGAAGSLAAKLNGIRPPPLAGMERDLKNLNTAINNLPASKTIDIHVNVHGADQIPGGGGAAGGHAGRTEQEFFQAGMTRMVDRPTSFNFVAGEAGAEQVSVTPLEGSRAGGGGASGDTYITNIYDGGAARVLRSEIRARKSQRLNAFMGVG